MSCAGFLTFSNKYLKNWTWEVLETVDLLEHLGFHLSMMKNLLGLELSERWQKIKELLIVALYMNILKKIQKRVNDIWVQCYVLHKYSTKKQSFCKEKDCFFVGYPKFFWPFLFWITLVNVEVWSRTGCMMQTVLRMFKQVLFWAENQGNCQNVTDIARGWGWRRHFQGWCGFKAWCKIFFAVWEIFLIFNLKILPI